MYHVVVGVGPDDDRATDKADAMADLPDATGSVRVTVVHAADDDRDPKSVPSVASALDRLEGAGVDARAVVVDADPTAAVLETAADVDADCICVGGRRRSPAGKTQLKSGAERVVLGTDRPVLVAGRALGDDGD